MYKVSHIDIEEATVDYLKIIILKLVSAEHLS